MSNNNQLTQAASNFVEQVQETLTKVSAAGETLGNAVGHENVQQATVQAGLSLGQGGNSGGGEEGVSWMRSGSVAPIKDADSMEKEVKAIQDEFIEVCGPSGKRGLNDLMMRAEGGSGAGHAFSQGAEDNAAVHKGG